MEESSKPGSRELQRMSPLTRAIWAQFELLRLEDGVLCLLPESQSKFSTSLTAHGVSLSDTASAHGHSWALTANQAWSPPYTKWAESLPLPNQHTSTCAREIVQGWIHRYGAPDSIHSD